jgi:pyruvate/2-oxoacid:ferredoxin oxidoreductase alpha subunit
MRFLLPRNVRSELSGNQLFCAHFLALDSAHFKKKSKLQAPRNIISNSARLTQQMKKLLDWNALKQFRDNALNPQHPVTRGTAQNPDIFLDQRRRKSLPFPCFYLARIVAVSMRLFPLLWPEIYLKRRSKA